MTDSLISSYNSRDLFRSSYSTILDSKIANSLALFESTNPPLPIQVDLYAILGGFPFSNAFTTYLSDLFILLQDCLGDLSHYLVKPGNHAIELLVLKWHTQSDQLSKHQVDCVINSLRSHFKEPIQITPYRLQLNDDGCLLFSFLDPTFAFRNLRSSVLSSNSFLPPRQSSWVHVPIGRILEVPSSTRILELKSQFESLPHFTAVESLTTFSIVHEHRWYMEERETIYICSL